MYKRQETHIHIYIKNIFYLSVFTWLKNREASISMSKYYFSFLLWMPSKQTDIWQETMCFSVYSYPAVRSWDSPNVQWTSVGHKCNCITCIPAPAKWRRNSWNIQVNLIRTQIWNSVYYFWSQYQHLSWKAVEIIVPHKKWLDWKFWQLLFQQ